MLSLQFIRFCLVGTIGFITDAGILQLLFNLEHNIYIARLISYTIAATVTWVLNTAYTFSNNTEKNTKTWFKYLILNTIGGVTNYLVFIMCINNLGTKSIYPVLSVVIGSITGLSINFLINKYFVFRT